MRAGALCIASVFALALVGAGCIRPTFLACGNNICPVATTCIDDTICATQDQLDACAALTDAAACHASSGDGYCTHGVCAPNSCGDGQLTGVEQCDGDIVSIGCQEFGYYAGTTSCTPLCTIDRSGCVGKCGDAIVQADQGEDCDGAPPTLDCTDIGFDYGALTCSHTCTADPNHSCQRFGWHKLGPVSYPVDVVSDGGIWAVREDTMIEVHDTTVSVHPGAYLAIDARAGDLLAATTTTVERYHAGAWTVLPDPPLPGGETITEVTISTNGLAFVLATASGLCSVGAFDGTTWTITPAPASCSHLIAFASDNFAVAASDGTHWLQFPNCAASCGCDRIYGIGDGTDTIFALRDYSAGGTVLNVFSFETSSSHIYQTIEPQCGSGPSRIDYGVASNTGQNRFVVVGTTIYESGRTVFDFKVNRHGDNRIETIAGPPSLTGAPLELFATRDGSIYGEADLDLYKLNQLSSPTTRTGSTDFPVLLNKTAMTHALDGTWVTCGQKVFASIPSSATTFQQVGTLACGSMAGCCTALFARSSTSIFAAMAPVANTPELDQWTGASWVKQLISATPIGAVVALAGNANIVLAVRSTGDVIIDTAGTWTVLPSLPAACTAVTVGVAPNGTAYAGGSCTTPVFAAVIWRYDAVQLAWVEVQREATATAAYKSLSIGSDGAVFASTTVPAVGATTTSRVVVGVGTTWTNYDGVGGAVSAVTATDAFATTTVVPIHVTHFDGARWTPVNVAADDYFFTIAATPSDLAVYGSLRLGNPNVAWQSFLRAP